MKEMVDIIPDIKTADIYDVVGTDGKHYVMVSEYEYYRFLAAAKNLIQAQRRALRTSDKTGIKECKERERKLLDYVAVYEAKRETTRKALFGK